MNAPNPRCPMTNRTPEEIARGLTELARWFVTSIIYDGWWQTDEDTPRGIAGPLTKAGILERERGVSGNVYRITATGLAVRSHLESGGR